LKNYLGGEKMQSIVLAELYKLLKRKNFIILAILSLWSLIYGFGASLGFGLVLVLFAALRERLVAADVPITFRGSSIALITAGLMSLAFMGFAGLVK